MKLGLMSAAFPKMSLERSGAKWAAGNGFEMLELACWPVGKADRRYAGVTHVDVTTLTPAQARKIQRRDQEATDWKSHRWAIIPIRCIPIRNIAKA